jgi:protein subunit release factor A
MTRERLDEFSYTRKDFDLDWYSGTGPGGQNRNKVQACLRLTHRPSGVRVVSADHRTRSQNLSTAMRRLRPLLEAWIRQQIGVTEYPRSDELVRTYHAEDNWVKDHASGTTVPWRDLDKHLDDLIAARARAGANPNKKSGRLALTFP